MTPADSILELLADMLAERVAAKLRDKVEEYTQDAPPPGMSKPTYLNHCQRRSWPNRKVGRLRITQVVDFKAWRDAHPLRVKVEPQAVESIADEVAYLRTGGRQRG